MCALPATLLTPLVGLITGTLIGVFAEPIRTWLFRPKLKILFDPARCVTSTPTYGTNLPSRGHYIRVQVTNASGRVAKGCRVFLVDVEQRDDSGRFQSTAFVDSLRLKWSSQVLGEELRGLDLPRGVSQFADVISTDKSGPYSFNWHVPFIPGIYEELFNNNRKTLRLTILATGDEARPARISIVFEWTGQWDAFKVSAG
jgi:hypothetical protein